MGKNLSRGFDKKQSESGKEPAKNQRKARAGPTKEKQYKRSKNVNKCIRQTTPNSKMLGVFLCLSVHYKAT
ncbi:MAG: hypothetical protein E6Q39_00970 [Crocinitomicaceae bacterium]|nr:MAG: hypothetical protein E6Q39_00970 [Crocinitomicaceae bacterium]